MKDGFTNELKARQSSLASTKGELESLYAEQLDDLKDRPDVSKRCDDTLRKCEAAITSYNGTFRSIKLAIVSWPH